MKQLTLTGRPRAVQYVRMSTDHQRYSIDNQVAAIGEYAELMGYDIVATYADEGKSGLTLRERKGLSQLLHDVRQPDHDFSIVLVLDVTRWGRFQDPDQSAAYEFFCREAGVRIEYAVEAFANDDSVGAAILKHLKRVMAAEYSRELSRKVTQAVKRSASLGFKQGGGPAYCVRRLVLDADGNERGILKPGDHKFLRSDKIVLIPGPSHEIEVVRKIFRLFVKRGLSMREVARLLNDQKVPALLNQEWDGHLVKRVLVNHLMIGEYVFNRTTKRLKSPTRPNPESEWVRIQLFKPLVDPELFRLANERLKAPIDHRIPDEEMIAGLKRLLRENGKLNWQVINGCSYVPCAGTYLVRFGSLKNAYELAGFDTDKRNCRTPRRKKYSDEFLFAGLRRLHAIHGWLSAAIIHADDELPAPQHYKKRFGSLGAAYRLAGLEYDKGDLMRRGMQRHWRLVRSKLPWSSASLKST
ncbi:recombinase family protein [Asticcacaulis benevestitus]|uniref:Resolvase/invertase-type recombinase catalytic domain-containing protein n=1 Tax=Asticcacaulis benevestitus DSM 16100 = ATCC BAA-896 TaxID=1121022 RepID=V4P7L4_9CAUL|nr:recombinase family protein [Asticcacaulis benevestitus]ESQ89942.1 hypothetical protein ABENE_13130 [Asticcacaulis benevestitus DSM 16100 = ATCC BAA-896]